MDDHGTDPSLIKTIWGLKTLLAEGVDQTLRMVQQTHRSAAARGERALSIIPGGQRPAQAIAVTEQVLHTSLELTRLLTRQADRLTDPVFALAASHSRSRPGGAKPGVALDQVAGALNGVFGDHLEARGNPLSVPMSVFHGGEPVALKRTSLASAYPDAKPHLVIFIHGLATTEWCWSLGSKQHHGTEGVTFGSQLEGELALSALYLRYNSGRHISQNGRALSALIGTLLREYPVEVETLTLVGHSMGGLVARSAAHYGELDDAPWVLRLRQVVCIGAPHLGAPLEKAASVATTALGAVDLPGTQIPAQILAARSHGIKDLRYGYTVDDEWRGRDPDALFANNRHDLAFVEGVDYRFIAGHVSPNAGKLGARLLGDLVVRLSSATGRSRSASLPFESGVLVGQMSHLQIMNHPAIYTILRDFLAPPE